MNWDIGEKVIYTGESFGTANGTIEQGMVGTIWGYPSGLEECRSHIRVDYPNLGRIFGMRTETFKKYTKLDAILK